MLLNMNEYFKTIFSFILFSVFNEYFVEFDVERFLYHLDDPVCAAALAQYTVAQPQFTRNYDTFGYEEIYGNVATTIQSASAKQCPANPNCFQGLVDTQFLSKLDSPDTIDQAVEQKIGKDPIFAIKSTFQPARPGFTIRCELKQPDPPTVGLQNLGATCYMNSLIQCIFADTTYRQAIFEWTPKVSIFSAQVPILYYRSLLKAMYINSFA